MSHKIQLAITLLAFSLIFSCEHKKPGGYTLAAYERKLCDSLQIDSTIIAGIRKLNNNKIEAFHYSLSKMYDNGKETELEPIHLRGIVFNEKNSDAYHLVLNLKDDFLVKGYRIFLLENNFGINNQEDVIAVLKTGDKYEVLKQIGTNGINYDITNDSLIKIMKQFGSKYDIDLIGASGDWCEFTIDSEPANWLEFANEVYKVCPDVVEQGTSSVEALAAEMKKNRRLYFWWD